MDPFREMFLRQVRSIISLEPSIEALHKLLTTVAPELTEDDILDSVAKRDKAFKELKQKLHPDKHPEDASLTDLLRDSKRFNAKCCKLIGRTGKKKKHGVLISYSSFPTAFNVTDKWPFLAIQKPQTPETELLTAHENSLEIFLAFRCLNARGAIAHRAATSCEYNWETISSQRRLFETAEKLFNTELKGSRRLEGVVAIKEELISRGPVLSTSFVLSEGFARSADFSDLFLEEKINANHPLLIVGWKLTPLAEVWLVASPFSNDFIFPVAVGQFGIDDLCLAPESDLTDVSWQNGPFLDLDLSTWPDEWLSWPDMTFPLPSSKLEELASCFKGGFMAAKDQLMPFVIRDEKKNAHSREFHLKEVRWDGKKKEWKVSGVQSRSTEKHDPQISEVQQSAIGEMKSNASGAQQRVVKKEGEEISVGPQRPGMDRNRSYSTSSF